MISSDFLFQIALFPRMTNRGGKPMTTYNDGLFGLGDDCKLYNEGVREKGEQ